MEMSRKTFLSLSGGAVLAAGLTTRGRVWGANERVRLACVGLRGRGWAHAQAAAARDDVEIAALCDVDAEVLANRAAEAKQKTGTAPKTYRDIRDLLADDSIDAVTVATPNHWHVLCGIWAMQAGKDVYLEKPISHTVWEGRQLVAAAKQYGRVLQHGAQRRSDPVWHRAVERLRSGIIGDVYWAKCVIHGVREPFWFPKEETPPPSLDWTLWQGPAPEQPFSRNYVHYNWHWFWHYGNGEIGNNGPHWADLVNWMIDKGLPVETHSTGGIFGYDRDARETPNTQLVNHRFADGTLMQFEVVNRFCPSSPAVLLYGTAGVHGRQPLLRQGSERNPRRYRGGEGGHDAGAHEQLH